MKTFKIKLFKRKLFFFFISKTDRSVIDLIVDYENGHPGTLIESVKLLKFKTNKNLKESKDYIDYLRFTRFIDVLKNKNK